MNILDFVLLTILAAALVRGIIRGMIRQVASFIGLIVGFVVAGHYYVRLLSNFRHHFPSFPFLEILSYIAVYAATWLGVVLLGFLFVKLSRAMLLAWADRFLGGILGLLKGVVAVVVLVTVLTLFLPSKSRVLEGSLLSIHFQRAGYYLVQLTPKNVRHRYEKRYKTLVQRMKQQKIANSLKRKIKK